MANVDGRYFTASGDPKFALIRDPILLILACVLAGMWGCPIYNVWQQGLVGEAALKRAEQDRRITVQEAQAKMDSASLLANAEVARAKGVAQANQIIGESLKSNEAYLRYLWITDVASNIKGNTVVYVPTEANMPILEAGKRP
jgi:regulator of protease activity HflC (stomatin/prohibitin superfamily)